MNGPCIDANPDIAGIGVRISIYAQAFLVILPHVLHRVKKHFTPSELHKNVHSLYTSILLTSCALLISAIVQASMHRLSTYHALIVLNLSWMNNFSVMALWSPDSLELRQRKAIKTDSRSNPLRDIIEKSVEGYFILKAIIRATLRGPQSTRLFIPLISAHLLITGALGLWVWIDLKNFGPNPECSIGISFGLIKVDPNFELKWMVYVLYGAASLPFVNVLAISIFVYILAFTVFGLALPFIVFTRDLPIHLTRRLSGIPTTDSSDSCSIKTLYEADEAVGKQVLDTNPSKFSEGPNLLKLVAVIAVQCCLIIFNEIAIQRSNDRVHSGEGDWTYGQTLAVILLCIPLKDTLGTLFGKPDDETESSAQPIKREVEKHRKGTADSHQHVTPDELV